MVCTLYLNNNNNNNAKRSPQIPFSLSVLRVTGKAGSWHPPGRDLCLPFRLLPYPPSLWFGSHHKLTCKKNVWVLDQCHFRRKREKYRDTVAKRCSRKAVELDDLNHSLGRVKYEDAAFGSGWHRSGSRRVARRIYG